MNKYKSCSIVCNNLDFINISQDLLNDFIDGLIYGFQIKTFLFASHGEFENLCREIITNLQKKYSNITIIEYSEDKNDSIIKKYYEIIRNSDYCLLYYDDLYEMQLRKKFLKEKGYLPHNSISLEAYNYATKREKIIFNMANI